MSEEPNLNDPLWIKISEDDGVNTYQKKTSTQTAVSFRGETTIPTNIEKIATVFSDPNLRKDWVDSLVEARTIEKISAFESIDYNHSKVPWPFEDRDFVYRVKARVNRVKRAMEITMASIEDSRVPPRSGIVRGKILYSSYWMMETPGPTPSTHLIIEVAVDPMGEIPMWMVNLTQKKWPHNTLLALRNVSTKPGLAVPKWIEDYFKNAPVAKGK
jgi:hypothetical protein